MSPCQNFDWKTTLTTQWLSLNNSLFNQKVPFAWSFNTGVGPPLFQCYLAFLEKQNTAVGEPNGKIDYIKPSVKQKLIGLLHMLKTGP